MIVQMTDYRALYHLMVRSSEAAIAAMEANNYGQAMEILINAEQQAEEMYIEG